MVNKITVIKVIVAEFLTVKGVRVNLGFKKKIKEGEYLIYPAMHFFDSSGPGGI
ncbi:MAG: hypothetical protein QXJ17_03030 [Nitrososphaeria archaeon]